MKLRTVWMMALAALAGTAAPAQTATPATAASTPSVERLDGSRISPAEIDATVTRLIGAAGVTGAGVAIFNRGEVAYVKAYGFRDKERGLALTPDSVMTAASLTKVAFAHLVMQLVDEGRIDLDRPVSVYLGRPLARVPGYEDLAGDRRAATITPRMLLAHTSGLPNWRWLADDGDAKLRIYFEPGSRYAYSGEGIALLQRVVEAVTKRPLGDLMRERVFEPFGMTRTSMVWEPRFESDFANAYDEDGTSLGAQRRDRADAAGSMQTTLADFARFMVGVARGTGLRPKTKALMLSPQVRIDSKHQFPTLDAATTDANRAIRLSYGLGWGLYSTPRGEAYFKEGHDDGLRHYTVYFAEKGIGVVIMTNSANGEGIYKELLETLLSDTYTPIEWEGFTPYDRPGPREP
jgi:CubicO group peptidase (beta-lactamase class C family)